MNDSTALFIQGCRVIDPSINFDGTADIIVAHGVIQGIGRLLDQPSNCRVIKGSGLIAAPGLIDMHVHLREPGYEYKETIAGGCRAAVAGGVTSMAAMPNTNPVTDDPSVVGYVLDKARVAGLANVFPIGAITKRLAGEEITEMGLLLRAGCVAFSDDGRTVMNSIVMRRALDYSRTFGALIIQHAEDDNLVGCGCMNESITSSRLGLPGIPNASEEIMVDRDIRLTALTRGRYHVAHISTAGAVEAVAEAQKKGLSVSCEVTPHHLVLTDEHVADYSTNSKMAPPLRGRSDLKALREALARGVISTIATDHAPHDMESKRIEFCAAANGVVGLETLLPICLELVRDNVLDLSTCLAKVTCNPARLLGINRGTLGVGKPADIVLFDPDEAWTVDPLRLHGMGRNTAFAGRKVKGRVKLTIVSGRIVHEAL